MQKASIRLEVLKIGGSLFRYSREIIQFLKRFSYENALNIVVVPGGGPFASFVRKIAFENDVSDDAAHWMAVLAMHQYAFFFTDSFTDSASTDSSRRHKSTDDSKDSTERKVFVERVDEIHAAKKGISVFLPFQLLREDDRLEHSWNVTSDTIAAFVAMRLGAKRLVKLTDVDGIYDRQRVVMRRISADEIIRRRLFGCVDEALPGFLKENNMRCIIVSGKHPERVADVLLGRRTICTEITPL